MNDTILATISCPLKIMAAAKNKLKFFYDIIVTMIVYVNSLGLVQIFYLNIK